MTNHMTRLRAALVLSLVMLSPFASTAAEEGRRAEPPAGPPATAGAPGADATPLTAAQVQQVRTILATHDPAKLTAAEAKAIHAAFREAGLRGGPALNEAVRAAGFDPDRLRDLDPPPDRAGAAGAKAPGAKAPKAGAPASQAPATGAGGAPPAGKGQYSLEQATSDRAQLNTIAFDGLAFLTGAMGCNTFLPPGKVADFCGFQYMRDVDTNQLGHNTSFVPRIANNVLAILDERQKAALVALAGEQEKLLTDFAYKRFPLIDAYCRLLEARLPAGRTGLDRGAVMRSTGDLFAIDGQLSYRRAEVLGGIIRSLTADQRKRFAAMAFDNSATWPERADQVDKRSLSHTQHVAVMTYASELFSWYAGNVEADTYFCPERHATYFGSFYMKDIPAMGNAGYSISTSLTGDSGEAFLAALTEPQRRLVTGLVDQQRQDLAAIVETRRAIATELRRFQKEATIDKAKVAALARRYGELDGEISYCYATAFSEVARTLTTAQRQALLKLRNLDARYDCKGAYLYSEPIAMPAVASTDFLFGGAGSR